MRNLSLFLAVIVSGCASIPSNLNLNDSLLSETETNDRNTVKFSLASDLSDDHKVTMGSLDSPSNINKNFRTMLNEYMTAKFNKLNQGSDVKIEVRLHTLDVNNKEYESTLDALSSSGTNVTVKGAMSSTIEIKKGNKRLGLKKVLVRATKGYHTQSGKHAQAFGDVINSLSNRTLIIMNKFIESKNL